MKISVCWFRRDLRLQDQKALSFASKSKFPVLPLFIFDSNILSELEKDDSRVSFIYKSLKSMHHDLQKEFSSGMHIEYGDPIEVWADLIKKFDIKEVYYNQDYEPYGIERDGKLMEFWKLNGISYQAFSDHVIFQPGSVLKSDGNPYTVYTPFKNKALDILEKNKHDLLEEFNISESSNFIPTGLLAWIELKDIGFINSSIEVKPFDVTVIKTYDETRDIPAKATSRIGPHLRFGTVSVRELIRQYASWNETYLSELLWREFFIHILFHFPQVVNSCFKPKYEAVPWSSENEKFEKWCAGQTGIPLVDAGMKELVKTGFMHNRVRMICAGFLVKNLLVDWRLGEAFFAKHLLDYELASNNGNWQWSAGCGCDSAPYFRVFNPESQLKKFDPQGLYINRWLPEFQELSYPKPIVDLKESRKKAIDIYKTSLS